MSEIKCPYCSHINKIVNANPYEEGVNFTKVCYKCEKFFTYQASIKFFAHKEQPQHIDCWNGDHQYKPIIAPQKEFTKMVCNRCAISRAPTKIEMKSIMETND